MQGVLNELTCQARGRKVTSISVERDETFVIDKMLLALAADKLAEGG